MNKSKAILLRAAKTTVQTLVASLTVTALTKHDIKIALITSLGAGVVSVINNLLIDLPEAEDKPDMSVTPEIPGEEIIDTSEEDDKLNGGGVGEQTNSKQGYKLR